jgi:hypothetical protein
VYRGPLIYSLKIGERWQEYNNNEKWPALEVFPTTPWNYGLVLDPKNPAGSIEVARIKPRLASQPFALDNAPIELRAKARRIPEWKQESNGLIGEVCLSPVRSNEPVEEVMLIPMGCARLRVSAFPAIGDGPDAKVWGETTATASASHVSDSLLALNDNDIPKNSADQNLPRFTWWDHKGTKEWVQYTFGAARKASWCEVYWFDDAPLGGLCRIPASWQVQWWDSANWQPVENTTEYAVAKDRFNRVEFKPVETKMLRIEVQLAPNVSGGILKWRFGE